MAHGPTVLRVASFVDRTQALGPGNRAAVWFHGCSFSCRGCIAEEMNRSTEFESFSPESLAARIDAIQGIEGVTLSGGDPFDQPLDLLVEFLESLHRQNNLSVLCYTGRTLGQLHSGSHGELCTRILRHVDILIDGLYVESLNDGSTWRGSSNQRVHFLTPRYQHLAAWAETSQSRQLEVRLRSTGELEVVGVPPLGFVERLFDQIADRTQ